MPNNDFDKVLKEKLESYEASFHPADWQKMEAMLPQNSGKFFFVIVSLFGLLLLGTAGLMLNNILNPKGFDENAMTYSSVRGVEIEPGYGGTIVDGETMKAEMRQASKEKRSSNREKANQAVSNEYTNSHQQTGESHFVIPDNDESHQTNEFVKTQVGNTKGGKKKKIPVEDERHFVSGGKRKAQDKLMTQTHEMTENITEEASAAEILASRNAGLIATISDNEQMLSTKEIPFAGKKKRKVFEFAFGAGAGIDFSFIDSKNLMKPGYAAGISQEFMFIDRIGLVLTESYVHRRYDGGEYPCNQMTGSRCPLSYDSDVQSVDFGIYMKANLIHKARWNWYAKAGVINVLKLKETFDYTYQDADTVPLPSPLPTQANYGSAPDAFENFDSAIGGVQTGKQPLPDLTISGTSRFHLAYHAATGFDVALTPRMKLQFEAGYSFTKPTVGADDKRLHSLGCNGSLLFLLGK